MTQDRCDVYERVTNKIIADLERGVRPWSKPWNSANTEGRIVRPVRHNGQAYRGINVLLLWGEATANGYTNPMWMTFNQAKELGAHVRRGERGTMVVYADRFTKTETTDAGEQVEHSIPFMRAYTVFNIQQIEELPDRYYRVDAAPPGSPRMARIANVDSFVRKTRADVRHGGNRAFNTVEGNYIQMPPFESFIDAEGYAATLLHELTHWTRHPGRLNRDFGQKRFGDTGYSREEIVAEIGAALLCADLGVSLEPRPDHASYIKSWIEVLRADKRAIFQAASHAERAAEYLHSLQTVAEPVEPPTVPVTVVTTSPVAEPLPAPVAAPAARETPSGAPLAPVAPPKMVQKPAKRSHGGAPKGLTAERGAGKPAGGSPSIAPYFQHKRSLRTGRKIGWRKYYGYHPSDSLKYPAMNADQLRDQARAYEAWKAERDARLEREAEMPLAAD